MAGESYAAGGIRTTVAATRAATDEQLAANVARLVAEMRRQGTTTVEIKSGYGLSTLDEARGLAIAQQYTDETTFLGAHVVPPEYAEDPAGYVDLVTGAMLEAAAPLREVDRRLLRDRCLRRGPGPDDPGRGSREGARRSVARQPARSGSRRTPGLRAGPGRGRPLHLPRRRRRQRPGRLRHGGDAAPRSRVQHPVAVPRRPRRWSTPASPWRWPATATPGPATPRRCRCASPWPSARCG